MVSRKTNKSTTIKKRPDPNKSNSTSKKSVSGAREQSLLVFRIKLLISLILLGLAVTTFTFAICFLIANQFGSGTVINTSVRLEEAATTTDTPVVKEYKKIDFQPTIDSFVNDSKSGNRSVIVYDLERDEIVGEYNSSEQYATASLYKLFVVYEGYRRLQSGAWKANDKAGSTGHTILECLDLSIRESYSPCAETLWAKIGRTELDRIIENDFKITNSDISHLQSNPKDILKIMKIFYEHGDITDETLISRMKDSFLNQPATTYDWRQGLPRGFKKTNVYNKVGWDYNPDGKYWNIYHDTAILEFPEADRHFIVVVMTNRVPYQKISQLGTKIENQFYQNN